MTDWPEGYGKRVYTSVDSTMTEAARLLPELSGPTWIYAETQTAARGRRGRPWTQPEGNLSASVVLTGLSDLETMGLRSFVMSLALFDAVRAVAGPTAELTLKWPNDVLLSGGKLAGILLESVPNGLIIGVGVNLADAPDVSEIEEGAWRPVSLKGETGADIAPLAFLDALAAAFAVWEQCFSTYGFGPIRESWLTHAARLGEPIRARTMREELHGTFETVDEAGHLVLTTSDGRKTVPAADVFF